MKPSKFTVKFRNGEIVRVRAFSAERAGILAMAERIQDGKDYKIQSITKEKE
jgi:hypothetical protein